MVATQSGLFKGVLPFSSYFLWTQKGFTRIPLARGSCFVLAYDSQSAFFTRHVVTAAHVALPIKFPECFGNPNIAMGLGERHITTKVLLPSTKLEKERGIAKAKMGIASSSAEYAGDVTKLPSSLIDTIESDPNFRVGRAIGDLNTNYKVDIFATTTVARQTFKQEASIDQCPPHIRELFDGLVPDLTPIQPGDELLFVGYDMDEEKASPHDGFLTMRQVVMEGTAVAAVEEGSFGTVVVCSTNSSTSDSGRTEVPASFAGGAVIRKSSGGVVGSIAAKTSTTPPPPVVVEPVGGDGKGKGNRTPAMTAEGHRVAFNEPCIDISCFGPDLCERVGENGVGFTPIAQFYNALRRLE